MLKTLPLLTRQLHNVQALLLTAIMVGSVSTATQAQETDYSDASNWLCRADDSDLGACDIDLSTTIVHADGRMAHESFTAATDPAIDCFYVYPTVSLDETANSDLIANEAEYNVIAQQFARFASRCRTFAPMYRQVTLTALRGGAGMPDRGLGYEDVLAAWNYYLDNYNNGRGVVLVSHSQGSSVLTQLIANEIEGKARQQQIVSAMLFGTTIQVPKGNVIGGTFKNMPLCTSAYQNECIIVYATFRDSVPPRANSLFGRNGDGTVAACVNPALLAKGSNEAHAYLNAGTGRTVTTAWTDSVTTLETPFASVPGLLTTQCVSSPTHTYLEMRVHGSEQDARTDDIAGDIMTADGTADAGWGLHLIDANLGMGDLLTLVDRQAVHYLANQE